MLTPRLTAVRLPPALLAEMVGEGTRAFPLETGGVLMGYWVPPPHPRREAVVTDAIGPGPRAVHAATRFEPDDAWQERRVAEAYRASGRLHTYLGDWHTHPNGAPRPSPLDRATARRIATAPAARAPEPLMVIIALRAGHPPQAAAYVHRRGRLRRVAITPKAATAGPRQWRR